MSDSGVRGELAHVAEDVRRQLPLPMVGSTEQICCDDYAVGCGSS
jgi:hypothetical protein